MGQRWQDLDELPKRNGALDPMVDETRALEWVELAGLIEIEPDGSWRPTAFGWAQLRKLQRARDGTGSPN